MKWSTTAISAARWGNWRVGLFRRNIPDLKHTVRAILLLPLLLAALIPQGFMPAIGADGGFAVVLCTQDGLRTVTLDSNGVEIPAPADEDDSGAAGHCVFSGIGAHATQPRVALSLPPEPVAARPEPLRVLVWHTLSASRQNGARAPPALL